MESLSHCVACHLCLGATLGHLYLVLWWWNRLMYMVPHWAMVIWRSDSKKGDVECWIRTPVNRTKVERLNLSATEAVWRSIDNRCLGSWFIVRATSLCLLSSLQRDRFEFARFLVFQLSWPIVLLLCTLYFSWQSFYKTASAPSV